MRRFRPLLLLLILPLLGSCYLPNAFEAEIKLLKNGTFQLSYQGELIYYPLVYEIAVKNLPIETQTEKMAVTERDLRRDSSFQEVRSLGRGRFKVRYKHTEKIEGTFLYTFVRRNAEIMSVKLAPTGLLTVGARTLKPDDVRAARQIGITINGTLKVVSDLPVAESNAQETKKEGLATIYAWRLTPETTKSPKIVFKYR
jgi:hypothetical protein